MKRIGYVGLSTPSFYDYGQPATRTRSDRQSSPNPIIEGAFGALLLYDELWFLCRSLCPENMRDLRCVKFLDEFDQPPVHIPATLQSPDEIFDSSVITAFHESVRDFDAVKTRANIHWDARADNHSHSLEIWSTRHSGNPWNIDNVVFDMLVAKQLPTNVELVTNSYTARLFKNEAATGNKLMLTEVLVLDSVPQYLSPKGPYHPCVEEVRESPFLSDFRKWIQTEALNANSRDLMEHKNEVEAKLKESQRNIFLKHLNPRGSYTSFAETMLSIGIDAILPGASSVKDLAIQVREERQKQELRWQGFIVDARHKAGTIR